MYSVADETRKPIFEGVQGENEARSIEFDITPWVEELGNGACTATAKRPTDTTPYPVTVTRSGNVVTWKPDSTDTAIEGLGAFQLSFSIDDVVAKTRIWNTKIAPSLVGAGDPPDPYDDWLQDLRDIAADALQDAQDADASAQDAEAWAKGTKNGTPVPSTADQYQNNAKYYSEESYKNAEAWAVGQRGGVDVPSTDPAYENNAKYWAGQAEDLKDATQAIVDEARTDVFEAMDGLHEETTAGSALQLISDKYTENKEPYLFRKSIAGDRELDTLVGGSIAWNQLANNIGSNWGSANATKTFSDGVVAFTATAQNGNAYLIWQYTPNHIYFFNADVKTTTATTSVQMNWYGGAPRVNTVATTNWQNLMSIGKAGNGSGGATRFVVADLRDSGWDAVQVKNPMVFDLTQMFGTAVADRLYQMEQANAGSGVALFRSWFPKDYYAYNTGELMSVKTTAHEMVGFNQWDEEWEVGGMNASNGTTSLEQDRIHSKNFIPVMSNTVYVLRASAGGGLICCYDSNKAFISSIQGLPMTPAFTFTTPSGCAYIKFGTYANYGNTYRSDICISISSDRNGEYEPYQKRTYALDDIELRGVPKLVDGEIQYDGDTYEADGTVTRRYGIVDLGTLNWTYVSATGVERFQSVSLRGNIKAPTRTKLPNILCAKFSNVTYDNLITWTKNDSIAVYLDGEILVRATEYTSVESFRTAMNGVYLIYELATPTTETADPFTSPQIVDAYGTERYVDERTVAVPVGHVTKYPDNLRKKLDGLPWDFSTLIAPTEKAYTATRNYTTGSLFIVGNILYKATANIANGGTITPNTNCTATTLAEVISAL